MGNSCRIVVLLHVFPKVIDFCQQNLVFKMQGRLKIIFSRFMDKFHGIHDKSHSDT